MAGRTFGNLNGQAVGIIMRDCIRRAIVIINRARTDLQIRTKERDDGEEDFVTSADTAAQEIFLTVLQQCFPGYGIVAEEGKGREVLSVPCTLTDCRAFFTIDSLDGTKAFIDAVKSGSSNPTRGIGTMCALVVNGVIVAAYVGNVESHDIVGFYPGADIVCRYEKFDVIRALAIDPQRTLQQQALLFRDRQEEFPPWLRSMLSALFRDIDPSGGSVGVEMTHLWSGEVGGAVLRPNQQTPWDLAPVVGISEQLGFVFLRPIGGEPQRAWKFEVFRPRISEERYAVPHVTLVIHRSRLPELDAAGVLQGDTASQRSAP